MRRLWGVAAVTALMFAAATALAEAPSGGDAAAGAKIFNQCKACHSIDPGKNMIGPSLAGVVGRKAGTVEGFNYSAAMKNSGLEWTPENIDQYLADPKGKVPGNKMAFPGLKNPKDRADVIAYLSQQAAKK